jgi:uncharacterized protein YbjQ (UPF0145 family)
MQIKCPQCQVLLEIPDHVTGVDVLHIECGACQRRFKLQLNRPSLKVRRPLVTSEHRAPSFRDGAPDTDGVILTVSSLIEGREIEQQLGPVSGEVPVAHSEEERQAGMLEALARAQEALRSQARAMGADGVIDIRSESAFPEEGPVLRLIGTAVRLLPPS